MNIVWMFDFLAYIHKSLYSNLLLAIGALRCCGK